MVRERVLESFAALFSYKLQACVVLCLLCASIFEVLCPSDSCRKAAIRQELVAEVVEEFKKRKMLLAIALHLSVHLLFYYSIYPVR